MQRSLLYFFTLLMISASNLTLAKDKTYDVVTFGAGLVDNIYMVSDEFLLSITENKGGYQPVSREEVCELQDRINQKAVTAPGGSAVNMTKGLSGLGWNCAVIGRIGPDEKGDYFKETLEKQGVSAKLSRGKSPTGMVVSMVTPDKQRTFVTYVGSAHETGPLEYHEDAFKGIKLFHIEGYQLGEKNHVMHTCNLAKEAGAKISMDLSNTFIVEREKEFLQDFLRDYVSIVFCNEDEAKVFTGQSPREACESLGNYCSMAVVTEGKKGCWVSDHGKVFHSGITPSKVKDTTGAGDLFVGGFLHGILKGDAPELCARYGAYTAANVISNVGAEIPKEEWERIQATIANNDINISKG